ncbi:MAG: hypothetical protein V1647_04125 [Pseudomonadota bacterium]
MNRLIVITTMFLASMLASTQVFSQTLSQTSSAYITAQLHNRLPKTDYVFPNTVEWAFTKDIGSIDQRNATDGETHLIGACATLTQEKLRELAEKDFPNGYIQNFATEKKQEIISVQSDGGYKLYSAKYDYFTVDYVIETVVVGKKYTVNPETGKAVAVDNFVDLIGRSFVCYVYEINKEFKMIYSKPTTRLDKHGVIIKYPDEIVPAN